MLDAAELFDLFEACEDGTLFGLVELLAAKVVLASLHVGDAQLAAERIGEEGDIFVEELLLEVLGAGGDDNAFAGGDDGDEVGEEVLPVPVPASTIRWRFSSRHCSISRAISS
ncbi:MAG: hypothetical protein R2724_18435 [Bryobacterales bacterium]